MKLLLALPLLLAVQDDAKIDDLIRRLNASAVEAREEAVRELVKLGAKALPALEKAAASADAETRTVAESILRRIRAAERVRELELDKKIPAAVVAEIPDVFEKALGTAEEKGTLYTALRDLCGTGKLREADLAWAGVLLHGPVSVALRTNLYVDARRWYYDDANPSLAASGRQILADLGRSMLADWARLVTKIADNPGNGEVIFDYAILDSDRGGEEDSKVSATAIEEIVEVGGHEVVPILIDIATDQNMEPAARSAAIKAVSTLRKKLK